MAPQVPPAVAKVFAATAHWSASHPVIALGITLLLTAALGAGMSQADTGRVSELFVPDDLEAQKTLGRIDDIWGRSDGSFLLYIVDDPTEPTLLRNIADDVASLRSDPIVLGVGGLPVILEDVLGDLDAASDQQIRAAASQIIDGPGGEDLASDDAILLRLQIQPDLDVGDSTKVLDDIAADSAADADVIAAGPLHLERAQQASGDADVAFLMPLSVGVLILVLSLLFRRVKDVAAPIAVGFLAIAMAYGTVAWVGLPLAPPSFVTMPLLLGLGIDYMLHIIYAFRDQDVAGSIPERFRAAASEVGAPVFFTALTTLIGFGSFLASNIPQIRVWGLLIGSGALYAFLLGFIALPAMYRIGRKAQHKQRSLPLGGITSRWADIVVANRTLVLVAVGAMTLGLGIAATQLDVETELDFELDDSAPEVQDFQAIEDRFGGQITAQVLIPSGDRDDLEALEAALDDVPRVGFVDGPIHRLERAGDPNGELVQTATKGVATDDWWRIIIGYPEGADAVVDDLRAIVADEPDALLTGREIVQLESQSKVLDSLFLSTGIALVLVLLLLFIVFRDLRYGALAFTPLVLIVLWQIGLQATLGIPLNAITGVITAMTLGIGVDYSLHIVNHYKEHRHEGREAATRSAIASIGRPVLAASMTTVFAFSVLGFSSLIPLRQFGYTAAIVITCAFIISLTFLPAITSLGSPARKAVAAAPPRVVEFEYRAVSFHERGQSLRRQKRQS